MRFDRPNDPSPIPASLAVSRGQLLVNGPVRVILLGGFGIACFLLSRSTAAGSIAAIVAFCGAWLWWSLFITEWREWAHARGADPDELQYLAVRSKLTWPKDSFFERTEIRRRGRKQFKSS